MSLSELNETDYFDINKDLSLIEIKEQNNGANCFIRDKDKHSIYKGFSLYKKRIEIICEISFYKSSKTSKFLPRLIFKKVNATSNNIIIEFNTSEKAVPFWKMVNFLKEYKHIVDTSEFENSYSVIKDDYFLAFNNKKDKEKLEDLKQLIESNKLKENDLKEIFHSQRKETIKVFYYLLKNLPYKKTTSIQAYKEKFAISTRGEEAVWHHFLSSNDWILGLNVDIKFIAEFIDEARVGIENSQSKGSPRSDILGLSNYTTLIELKTASTKIFKNECGKGKARANTCEFTPDFIEGISQCLGQKSALTESYSNKHFIKNSGIRVNKEMQRTLDPQTIFIIGNRENEFPHSTRENENFLKSETFERYRRNSRNIDIITYDELFERAYHIVFSKKIKENWYMKDSFENIINM